VDPAFNEERNMELIVVLAVLGVAAIIVADKMGWLPEPVKPEPAKPEKKKKVEPKKEELSVET